MRRAVVRLTGTPQPGALRWVRRVLGAVRDRWLPEANSLPHVVRLLRQR